MDKIRVVLLCNIFRPTALASLMLGLAFINRVLPPLIEVGEFTIRYVDIATVLLVWVAFWKLYVQRISFFQDKWWIFFRPLIPFFIYAGLSIGLVQIYVPDVVWASVASYIRLVITILMGWLIYMSIEKEDDLELIVKSILIFATISIIFGIWQAFSEPLERILIDRYGGFLGINNFGFVSGLLIVWSVVAFIYNTISLSSIIALLIGLFGLFLSKSATSIMAVIATILFLGIVLIRAKFSKKMQIVASISVLIVGIGLLIGILRVIRSSDLIGLLTLSSGSWAQRLILAYAALQIFFNHPLGVGWQASKTKAIIGDPNLNKTLMETFPQFDRGYLFVDYQLSLHNMYLQILAELGIIGFLLFTYGIARVAKMLITLTNKISAKSQLKQHAMFCAIGLVYLLIWWNSRVLFGGHIESILAVSFLSIIAKIGQFEDQNKTQKSI
jgi:O-antigen ligase